MKYLFIKFNISIVSCVEFFLYVLIFVFASSGIIRHLRYNGRVLGSWCWGPSLCLLCARKNRSPTPPHCSSSPHPGHHTSTHPRTEPEHLLTTARRPATDTAVSWCDDSVIFTYFSKLRVSYPLYCWFKLVFIYTIILFYKCW